MPKIGRVSSEPGSAGPASPRASVLVATSDSATRELLRRILHVGAVEVIDASDGLEALALARRLDLDLIVLDAFLAVMDGITVCGRIRALREVEQPPIIIVGLISERAVEVALSAGADETLSKPLNPALIRNRMRVLLTRRQAEKRASLVERALEAAPAGVTVLDARSSEYSLEYANAAFLQLTGYGREELVGHNLRLLMGPETDVAAMTKLRDAMAAGRPTRVLLKNQRKDGHRFWNDLATTPLLDASGRLTHFVAVQHDVTQLLEAPEREAARAIEEAVAARTQELDSALVRVEKRRRFTETILNSMVSAILATDADGTVSFANLAALRTLGTSLADCVGRSVVELFGHHEGVAEVVRGAGPPHPEHRLDFPLITPGGARFYIGMSITPAPPELRDEVGLIFLFRNLAETIEDAEDPRLRRLDDSGPTGFELVREPGEPAEQAEGTADERGAGRRGQAGERAGGDLADDQAGRRVLLSLRYCAPGDLVHAAVESLAAERGTGAAPIPIESEGEVPEVLMDRQQVTEALTILLASALDRCGDPASVRVRLTRTEAAAEKSGHLGPAARIEIFYPRALITEHDLGSETALAGRQSHRRTDLTTAEKLLEANGGRLIRPVRDGEEQVLAVLLRAAP